MVKTLLTVILRNPVFANVLMILILLCGFVGARIMVREIFPRFSFDLVAVAVPYPGADPDEVEEGICLKLEGALEGIDGVRRVTTTANEGTGSALVECDDNADVHEVRNDVKNAVDAIITFPRDAEKPIVREVKARSDVLAVALWGDLPESQLRELARGIREELLGLDEVSQVSISGIRDYEISVQVSEESLRRYGLTFAAVSRAVSRGSLNLPAGSIRTEGEEIRLRAFGRRYVAADYGDIAVLTRADGTVVRLGQIAAIRDSFSEDSRVRALFNGERAVSIDVLKTDDEDSIRIAAAVETFLARKSAELPDTVHLTKWRDNSRLVQDRLSMLLRNGRIGLLLVFLSLWLFLDLRLSFWVAMGIPISVGGGLALMAATGESLNMLSLFGLIMVLGLIVDDAIVVGEAVYVHRRQGEEAAAAAVAGTAEVAWPVVAAVVTTVVAFVPLFFVSGIMGKFIRHIPLPVVAALSVSLVEALLILPVHLRHLPDMRTGRKRPWWLAMSVVRRCFSGGLEWTVEHVYGPAMDRVLRWRYVAVAVSIAVLAVTFGLIQGGIVKYVLFPETDTDFLRATIELPTGTPLAETRAVADQLQAAWRRVEAAVEVPEGKSLTKAVYALLGATIGRGGEQAGDHLLQIYVELLATEERQIHYRKLARRWRDEAGPIANALATEFAAPEHGPGGKALEIQMLSADQDELLAASRQLAGKLESLDGVYDVQLDHRPGKRELRVSLRPEASPLGLTLADVAQQLRQGFYGDEALRLQRGRDDVKVKVRYPLEGGRDTLGEFERVRIRTGAGAEVPLGTVARIEMAEGFTTIRRQDRKRVVTVSADVDRSRANAQEITVDLERRYLPGLTSRYSGLSYSTEGQAQRSRESLASLQIGFPLAMFGIYLILATIFRSYVQPLVIMISIPFGLIGAVYGHLIVGAVKSFEWGMSWGDVARSGMPLTMLSLFGMVALAGIVVNDAIVLVEAVNVRLSEGMPLFVALREGGKRRFRAIFLTTLTTFAGLTPIILEKSMQAQFLVPMAISIAFGVLFATLLTLLVIPCLLGVVNDVRRLLWLARYQRWPEREEVEPATKRS